ncbi:Uncharacterised protein [Peptostreptococcus anaerobius]|uniref:Uncharacterized protein n=1 Tax=Peptostreptococcus anaerobius TaxID=1261 RepID=A0A379CJ80_9FIRM|nr:hypothetical protein [Peptostreptococcus anaerobius]SFM87063.1 hypothetical protein SAMN05660467_00650 [Peptostreptococcus anaerobius]SUB60165.1 Uncharacterised protein [Peptostreptococcus anaerobius]SUB62154.1 Uncharacterised protein [Peptostreptococcus anaerobius]
MSFNDMCMNDYKDRVLRNNKLRSLKDVEKQRAIDGFKKYLNTSITAHKVKVTDVDEVCITSKTKTALIAINDIANNDDTSLDEKEIFTELDLNVGVGCYVRFDNCDWLITFQEHQPIGAKKQFIMRRCNGSFSIKHEGEIYKIPISTENLTMYSDGVADGLFMSHMDSKKQIWYGSNPVTRTILEGFRVLLTHRTAFRITHINDFEYNGLIKSLILQTAVIKGDNYSTLLANNESYYKTFYADDNEESPIIPEDKIIGNTKIIIGEQVEYTIKLSSKHTGIKWDIEENEAFTILSQTDSNIVIRGSNNFRLIGNKIRIKAIDKNSDELIDSTTVTLRRK